MEAIAEIMAVELKDVAGTAHTKIMPNILNV
jgi:hypothetical protein